MCPLSPGRYQRGLDRRLGASRKFRAAFCVSFNLSSTQQVVVKMIYVNAKRQAVVLIPLISVVPN
jgi:hypothetical protein